MYSEKLKDADMGITFDDVLLLPQRTPVEPKDVSVRTNIGGIELQIPIVSSPMDTVTEEDMAIAMARAGGIGIVHRNIPVEREVEIIEKVKKEESFIIRNVDTVTPDMPVKEVRRIMQLRGITGLPVVEGDRLVGIITIRDIRFYSKDESTLTRDLMTSDVITAPDTIEIGDALEIMHRNRIEKLPVVDSDGHLVGLITAKDIMKRKKYPNATRDSEGRLAVGAATGPFDVNRAVALEKAGADIIVVDTAHAHSENVMNGIKKIVRSVDIPVVGGNIATAEAAEDLISLGVSALRVGIGPGSICTTRIVAGVGVPQLTAIAAVADVAMEHGVSVIADGGIRFSGDIVKAIAAGADAVMIGSLLAGTTESPGRELLIGGRKYKYYRGMGSVAVMKTGLSDRYSPVDDEGRIGKTKMVPEGVEGAVPYKGDVDELLYQLVGGLKSGMGYVGARDLNELKKNGRFIRISPSAVRESHPHDIRIISEAPNYPTNFEL